MKVEPLRIIPRCYGGCDWSCEHLVLAYRGDLHVLFKAPPYYRGIGVGSIALVWARSGKAWHGRLEGYRTEPARLAVYRITEDADGYVRHEEHELTSGGRLSRARVLAHAEAIDAAFGVAVAQHLNTKATLAL